MGNNKQTEWPYIEMTMEVGEISIVMKYPVEGDIPKISDVLDDMKRTAKSMHEVHYDGGYAKPMPKPEYDDDDDDDYYEEDEDGEGEESGDKKPTKKPRRPAAKSKARGKR